jgi:hypothetical protein
LDEREDRVRSVHLAGHGVVKRRVFKFFFAFATAFFFLLFVVDVTT